MADNDAILIKRCLAGEQSAWNTLVDRYSRLVYSVINRNRLSATDAEDLFQTVFILLFRSLDRLKDQSRLPAWLVTATHRECWRMTRNRRRLREVAVGEEPTEIPPDEVTQLERQQLVQESLTRVGGRCEQLLRALFLDPAEPDYDAIAKQLGMPVGSIGPTRARCFEKLQQILKDAGLGDDDRIVPMQDIRL